VQGLQTQSREGKLLLYEIHWVLRLGRLMLAGVVDAFQTLKRTSIFPIKEVLFELFSAEVVGLI
jgi:hypothetical protein